MTPQVYKTKMDKIVDVLEEGFFAEANRLFAELLRQSNVNPTTCESQLKTALFQRVGPKVDKIWGSFKVAGQASVSSV